MRRNSRNRRKRKVFRAAVVEGFGLLVFIGLVFLTIPGLLDESQAQSNNTPDAQVESKAAAESKTLRILDWKFELPRSDAENLEPVAQVNFEQPLDEQPVRVSQARFFITDNLTIK